MRRRRVPGHPLAACCAALLLASCARLAPPPLERSYPTGNEARLERLQPRLAKGDVHRIMGDEPIPNPLDAERPFANPHLELRIGTPDGRIVDIWLYLTILYTHADCPRLTWLERPVVFEDGRMAFSGWDGLRERRSEYGRSADWYRKVRYPRFERCRQRGGGGEE